MMVKLRPRRLVIDADVAHSASESKHPISSTCRKFLETMLEIGHHVVMTDEIKKEWHLHISKYSRRWRRQMYGRRLVTQIKVDEDKILRGRIDAAVHLDQKAIVAKDVHLIEAAIATDRLVASQDERARRAFGNASANVSELKRMVWVNPTQDGEKPIDWLRDGAKTEAHRQLGV